MRNLFRRRPALLLGGAALAAVLGTVAAAVFLPMRGPAEARRVHVDGEGPLSATSGEGGNSIDAPPVGEWTATYGSFGLCRWTPGPPITIERVRIKAPLPPRSVEFLTRTFDPQVLAGLSDRRRADYLGFYTATGRPPDFSGPKGSGPIPGDYQDNVPDLVVSQTCAEMRRATRMIGAGPPPTVAPTELIFVVGVGPRGADITDAYVDYRTGGREYSLHMRWELVACGTALARTVWCDGRDRR